MPSFVCGFSQLVTLFLSVFSVLVAAAPWGQPFSQPSGTHITSVSVDLKVPEVPGTFSSGDTIFIWSGVQPGTALQNEDPASVGNGIFTPSLTYGRSCAPGGNVARNSWWISGSYFNIPAHSFGSKHSRCQGGDVMDVEPGEIITCSIVNTRGTQWAQTCSRPSGQSVSYSTDMDGQQMNWASLSVYPGTKSVINLWSFPVYVYNYRFTTSAPMSSSNCVITLSGDNYVAEGSNLSEDRMTCSLRAVTFWNSDASATPVESIPS